jgi:tetratricopeptide (TPR) repeat protein
MKALGAAALALAMLATAAGAGLEKPAVEQRGIFEDLGSLTDAAEDEAGVWLSMWQPYVRFRIEPEPEAKRSQLAFAIKRATEGYRSVSIRYDTTRGRLNRKTGTLDYPLCALALDDLLFEPSRACKAAPSAALKGPEAALVLAQAYLGSGEFQRTLDLLARSDLPPDSAFRKILLKVRAAATDGIALSEAPESLAADQASAASLADYRALALLEPDDVEHHFALARALQDLGGYAEASAAYDVLLKRWPNEDFRVAVRRGALYRGQGDYEKALDALNQLVARNRLYDGMKFRYHRAWTLSLLGRYDEAIADLSEGLRTQPDYAPAYVRRACALASVGRLHEAADDVAEATRLYSAYPGAAKALRQEIAEVRALGGQIEMGLAESAGKRVGTGCSGPSWRSAERPRPRSALLGSSGP